MNNIDNNQIQLGECYANGDSVERNDIEAARWYQLAAKQDNADAQMNLALCYKNGDVVEIDLTRTQYWYDLSTEVEVEKNLKNNIKPY
ncbi:MAG: tetratricopeptide repeat protein [Mycoplasma sp.]